MTQGWLPNCRFCTFPAIFTMSLAKAKKLSIMEQRFLNTFTESQQAQMAVDEIRALMQGIDDDIASKVLMALTKKNLIELYESGGVAMCRMIHQDEQDKISDMDKDEKLIYNCIKAYGTEGVWIRTIQARTSMHANVLNKALKKLEQKGLVKTIKSVKHGNKKLYMLSELQPSSEVTGGVWFTDQELDVDFVDTIARSCLYYISKHSVPKDPKAIFPLNYNGFPTITAIMQHIKDSRIANVELSEHDIEAVLDMLVFDNKLERIPMPAIPLLPGLDGNADDMYMYRILTVTNPGIGWSQMPCGMCPIKDDCSEFSVVNPRNCQYLTQWLDF